jgi:hypothetical protein
MNSTSDIVQRLWSLCHVLRDDGITYHEYVTELTYLLFLKMAAETGTEHQLPEGYRWPDLTSRDGDRAHAVLPRTPGLPRRQRRPGRAADLRQRLHLPPQARATCANWSTDIDGSTGTAPARRAWATSTRACCKKNADEKKSGAGQYFTPRPLIDCMVASCSPTRRGHPGPGRRHRRLPHRRRPLHARAHHDYFDSEAQQRKFRADPRLPRRRAGARHPPPAADEPDAPRHRLSANLVNGIRSHPRAPGPAEGRPHPHQPALRHQEGRRSAQPRRLLHHRRHLQQAARLRRAHLPRAQARRPRRRRPAGQRAVRGQHRPPDPRLADGQVRPAHHPAPAHRHLLRPGRQDQRAVLHPRPRSDKANTRPSGSTTCAPTCPPSARRAADRGSTSPSSRPPSATTRYGAPSVPTRARTGASAASPGRPSPARRQSGHRLAAGRAMATGRSFPSRR